MHRFFSSLLALLGALTLPHGSGRADPRTASGAEGAKAPAGQRADKKADEARPAEHAGRSARGGAEAAKSAGRKSAAANRAAGKKPVSATDKAASGAKGTPTWTKTQPGVIKLVRGSESLEVRVLDRKQRLVPTTLPRFAKFLRSKGGADHPIDARLVTLLATVSDHFGGREVNVVSGFRPYSPNQYSRHSNHNEGRAIDFSIKGVANETLRDYCRTLHNVGVGYYPNSLFVHLDVRETNAYWVDYAAPGQAPRYRAPDGTVDEEDEAPIASVDRGPQAIESPSQTLRSDVMRGPKSIAPLDR